MADHYLSLAQSLMAVACNRSVGRLHPIAVAPSACLPRTACCRRLETSRPVRRMPSIGTYARYRTLLGPFGAFDPAPSAPSGTSQVRSPTPTDSHRSQLYKVVDRDPRNDSRCFVPCHPKSGPKRVRNMPAAH